jgi:hypothetical protein
MAVDTPVTGEDLISLALTDAGILGIGQTANAYDMQNGLRRLNWMLAQWRMKRWLVFHLVTVGITSTGAQSYTVGPGGDLDVDVRPDRLESAFFRQLVQSQPNQIDYPLELLQSREDYNNIALKSLTSFPSYIFYDSGWPLGTIYPWPVPQAAIYSVFISLKAVLSEVAVLGDQLLLPQEYMLALYLSLAELLRIGYQLPPDPMLTMRAKEAREVLRGSNYQIARLRMPTELTRPGIYNPYSDQIR